jgi:proline racemase
VKLTKGKLLATIACSGSGGICHVILEISDGKVGMKVPVAVAAGKQKKVKVKPSRSLGKAIAEHPKKLRARVVVAQGKPKKVKVG